MRRVLQHKFLWLNKLRDHALSRSALPSSRAAPTRLSRRSRSRVDRAHYGAHSLPLRRRPVKKKKPSREGNNSKGHQAVLTCQYSQQRQPSASGSSTNRRPARKHSSSTYKDESSTLKSSALQRRTPLGTHGYNCKNEYPSTTDPA